MATIIDQFVVVAAVSPSDTLDAYATHRAKWGQGGFRTVFSTQERDDIPVERREAGMQVCVYPAGGPAMVYMLAEDLVTWVLVKIILPQSVDAVIIEESLVFQPYQPGLLRAQSTIDLQGAPADASLWVDGVRCASGLVRDVTVTGHRFNFFIGSHVSYVEARAVIVKRM